MALLDVSGLTARYGKINVLHGIDFSINGGDITIILGSNGAGKTTTLRAISGVVERKGRIIFDGADISRKSPEDIVKLRIAQIPQGRGTFRDQTVHENLVIGAYIRRDSEINNDLDRLYEMFPILHERRHQYAGQLSGGEQQMLAIGRALMLRPRLLLLDEPSLGLAPIIVRELFETLQRLRSEMNLSMLIVEQNVNLALSVADYVYVLDNGHVSYSGTADEVRGNDVLLKSYLG
jgi:branched-chain amino acid transport system ATP-binding protein